MSRRPDLQAEAAVFRRCFDSFFVQARCRDEDERQAKAMISKDVFLAKVLFDQVHKGFSIFAA